MSPNRPCPRKPTRRAFSICRKPASSFSPFRLPRFGARFAAWSASCTGFEIRELIRVKRCRSCAKEISHRNPSNSVLYIAYLFGNKVDGLRRMWSPIANSVYLPLYESSVKMVRSNCIVKRSLSS